MLVVLIAIWFIGVVLLLEVQVADVIQQVCVVSYFVFDLGSFFLYLFYVFRPASRRT
jgi:hypothetical protein